MQIARNVSDIISKTIQKVIECYFVLFYRFKTNQDRLDFIQQSRLNILAKKLSFSLFECLLPIQYKSESFKIVEHHLIVVCVRILIYICMIKLNVYQRVFENTQKSPS